MIGKIEYNWTRYWQRGDLENYGPVDGFLPDPENALYLRPGDLKTLASLRDVPCLILLGSPGIGKSFEMITEEELLSDESLRLDLKDYHRDNLKAIFDHHDIKRWISGEHELTLFLDGLDEGKGESYHQELGRQLRDLHNDRLKLRISCRDGKWPSHLENVLRELYPIEAQIEIRVLQPLRETDVREAASQTGLDPEIFLEQIYDQKVEAIAARPVTLNMLLSLDKFPDTRCELYEKGMVKLASEAWKDEGPNQWSSQERFAIAARIAACMEFSGRNTIIMDDSGSSSDKMILTAADILGTEEQYKRQNVPVIKGSLKETLDTALFEKKGEGWQFVHKSFSEFLAAFWVVELRGMALEQAKSLVQHPSTINIITPQLLDTTAWMISLKPDWVADFIDMNYTILLHADPNIVGDERKRDMVDLILEDIRKRRVYGYWNLDSAISLFNLSHKGLAAQLASVIKNPYEDTLVREAALWIAGPEESQNEELVALALELILDKSENRRIRYLAGRIIAKSANVEIQRELKDLVLADDPDDVDDELKGALLSCTAVSVLTPGELIPILTKPKRRSLFGAYKSFLRYELPSLLSNESIPQWLRWIYTWIEDDHSFEDTLDLERVGKKLFALAFSNTDNEDVSKDLAKILWSRNNHFIMDESSHDWLDFLPDLWQDNDLRTAGVRFLIESCPDDNLWDLSEYLRKGKRNISLKDIIKLIKNPDYSNNLNRLATIARKLFFRHDNPEHWATIRAIEDIPEIMSAFQDILEYDGPESWAIAHPPKLWEQKHEEARLKREEEERNDYNMFLLRLKEHEEGTASTVWDTFRVLMGGGGYADMRKSKYWSMSGARIRNQILKLAHEYVNTQKPDMGIWFPYSKGKRYYPDTAAYGCFALLAEESPEQFEQIPADVWHDWGKALVCLAQTFFNVYNSGESLEPLLASLQFAEDESVMGVCEAIVAEDEVVEGRHSAATLRFVKSSSSAKLESSLFELLNNPKLSAINKLALIDDLVQRDYRPAKDYCLEIISNTGAESLKFRNKISAILLKHGSESDLRIIWDQYSKSRKSSMRLILKIAGDTFGGKVEWLQKFDDAYIRDLALFMFKYFPPERDPEWPDEGMVGVEPRREVSRVRSFCMDILKERGTAESMESLREIRDEFPQYDWLEGYITGAKHKIHVRGWEPLEPGALLELAVGWDTRLIRGSGDLLNLVIESLERLKKRLKDNPVSKLLRVDQDDKGKPVREELVTAFISDHLNQDLIRRDIILDRELTIDPIQNKRRLDLRVLVPTSGQAIADLVIEVKGDWNSEWATSLKPQIYEKYMDRGIRYSMGIYLVAYFHRTSQNSHRIRSTPEDKMAKMKTILTLQARSLSEKGVIIKPIVLPMG